MDRVILHADMNNFYASVECVHDPSLRGNPVAVAGSPESRHGIVLAKNYAAKACGVATGNPLWLAKQRCPDIVFVPPHYELYLKYSEIAREIYGEYTDQVESFGLDESWLDVTASAKMFGDGKTIADELRRRIKFELGVTISVGVSYNKVFAKLGSDMKKPDATTVIDRDGFRDTVWPLPVSDLLFVGRATLKKLLLYGINTIGDLALSDQSFLVRKLGQNGSMLWLFANGLDTSPVADINAEPIIKSIGNSTTTPRDLITDDDIKITLYVLAESVSARMREHGFTCKTVQLHVRDNELYSYERQAPLPYPNRTARSLFDKAFQLYKLHHTGKPVRSIGIRACSLLQSGCEQLSFMPEIAAIQTQETIDGTVDRIRSQYGHFAIRRCVLLRDTALSALNPKDDHLIHPESLIV